MSWIEKIVLISLLNRRFQTFAKEVNEVHKKKLKKLWVQNRFRSPDCLINLSKKQLTLQEENALRCSLKHHILPKKIEHDDIKVSVEKVFHDIEMELKSKEKLKKEDSLILDNECKDKVKVNVNSFVSACKNICGSRKNQSLHNTLHILSKDENIKICRFDKGNGVVILDAQVYKSKMESIVLNKTKFQEIIHREKGLNPIIIRHNSVKDTIEECFKIDKVSDGASGNDNTSDVLSIDEESKGTKKNRGKILLLDIL